MIRDTIPHVTRNTRTEPMAAAGARPVPIRQPIGPRLRTGALACGLLPAVVAPAPVKATRCAKC